MSPAARLLFLLAVLGCQRPQAGGPASLTLDVVDLADGRPTPARFSLVVDGRPWIPDALGEHGLRFHSVHEAKNERWTATYARGTGPVEFPLPPGARRVEVRAAKGLEYLPAEASGEVAGSGLRLRVGLRRWADLAARGWTPADEHVHYDRLDRAGDRDWLTMMAADGLAMAHFMVLKGGKVPGVWAVQHAYGPEGEAGDGERLIRPGEEYRDNAQGHINLLGIRELIEPISTGGLGEPPVPHHHPHFHDVFQKARALGGLGGVAHAAHLGREPTAVMDVVLGAVDFFEIANTHLYSTELWYRLLNCGYDLPPAGGTDLPNFPFRDPWQPFLGSVRMYVRVGAARDFESWKAALKRGEVFVTSGPLADFSVDGQGPGGLVRLPEGGGEVTAAGEFSTPIGLREVELVHDGRVVPAEVERSLEDGVHRWRFSVRLRLERSGWLAARARGIPIEAIQYVKAPGRPWLNADVVAHTAPVRIEVGGTPRRSPDDAARLVETLRRAREFYRVSGNYPKEEHRAEALALFNRAIAELEKR